MKTAFLAAALLGSIACATPTRFVGDPHIAGGPAKCTSLCQAWGMDLVGMVANGEYSDGCICQVRGARLSVADVGGALLAQGSTAMVVTRQAEEAARQAAQNH